MWEVVGAKGCAAALIPIHFRASHVRSLRFDRYHMHECMALAQMLQSVFTSGYWANAGRVADAWPQRIIRGSSCGVVLNVWATVYTPLKEIVCLIAQ